MIHCEKCDKTFTNEENVVNFLEKDFYWGELTQEEMKKINKIAKEKGYREALIEVAKKHPKFAHYVLSSARATWLFHCYSENNREKCLDIGSGWGSLAFVLSDYYDEVWSLEAVKERIEFQKIRKDQEKLEKVKLVRADMLKLPFPDNFFDLVACNGVLEWAALKGTEDPREMQKNFIKEIRRVLKPDGCIYIGIENRVGYQYWIGHPDHPGTPFTSLMPRKAADFVVKHFRAEEEKDIDDKKLVSGEMQNYRTYTYTINGYKDLLHETGFGLIDFYWCAPSYGLPLYSGKANGESMDYFTKFIKNTVRSPLKSSVASIISAFGGFVKIGGALTYFWPAYLIFSYKDKRPETTEKELINNFRIKNFFSIGSDSHNSPVVYCYKNINDEERVLKVYKEPKDRIDKIYEIFNKVNRTETEDSVINGFTVYSEPKFEGKFDIMSNEHNRIVLDWLTDFQKNHVGTKIEDEYGKINEYVTKFANYEYISESLKNLFSGLSEKGTLSCAIHGDFWAKNIFVNVNELHLIDWEFYEGQENPVFDICFFSIANSIDKCGRTGHAKSFGNNFTGNGEYSPILKKNLRYYSEITGIPMHILIEGIPYTLVKVIMRHDIRLNNSWNRNFGVFTELLNTWIDKKEEIRKFLLE